MKVSIIVTAFNEEKVLGESLSQIKLASGEFARFGWNTELIVCHDKYIYLSKLDSRLKNANMRKNKTARLKSLQQRYHRLARSLASTGYISQGSVLDRSALRRPRSGYQWTRKVAQKTLTLALSPAQFQAVGKAVENRRKLGQTLTKMENLSRQILFSSLPDTRRRKRLSKKVLRAI